MQKDGLVKLGYKVDFNTLLSIITMCLLLVNSLDKIQLKTVTLACYHGGLSSYGQIILDSRNIKMQYKG